MQANQQLQEIIAKSWSDPDFKQQLIDNPVEILKQQGLELPEGKNIKVLADDEQTRHLVIPARTEELEDEHLNQAAGGVGNSYYPPMSF